MRSALLDSAPPLVETARHRERLMLLRHMVGVFGLLLSACAQPQADALGKPETAAAVAGVAAKAATDSTPAGSIKVGDTAPRIPPERSARSRTHTGRTFAAGQRSSAILSFRRQVTFLQTAVG